MIRVLPSLLLLCFSLTLIAQKPIQTLRGQVSDKDTQFPLIGATITLLNTNPMIGSTSDIDGQFRLEKIPVGRYDLRISYLGYQDFYINQLLIGSGKEVILNIELQESVEELETVTVIASEQNKGKANNEMAMVSARSFSVEETGRFAAGFSDPARMAQSFAGVSATSDQSNEIVIRGNSAKGLLYQIEGIEIPNPNHFSSGEGSSGGGVSILANTVLSNSDFFTGAFPAEYGNALSGVFDIKLRKGNNEKREFALQAGILGIQAALEGPFIKKSKASYLFNYRFSSLGLLNAIGFEVGDAVVVPKYQDLSFNINIPTKHLGRFTIFGIGGLSDGGTSALRDSTKWVYSSDREELGRIRKMGVIGFTHTFLFKNNKTYLKTIGAYSIEDDIFKRDRLDDNYNLQFLFKDNFVNSTARGKIIVNHKFNAKHILKAGVSYDWMDFRSALESPNINGTSVGIYQQMETDLVQAFIQWHYRPINELEITTGIHETTFILNNNHALEPRFGARWQFNPRMNIAYGLGLHSKLEPISLYYKNLTLPLPDPIFIFEEGNSFLFSPQTSLRLTQSVHNVLSYNWNFAKDFRLKVELYHQLVFNVPISSDSSSVLSTLNFNSFDREFDKGDMINSGRGENYGIELTVEKFFSKQYYFLFTASLFQSKFKNLDNIWRNTRFNRNYIFNLLGGKEWSLGQNKEHILGLNFKILYAGGERFSPIDLAASLAAGTEISLQNQIFEGRIPDYFRVDASMSYRWNQPKFSLVTTIDVQNVLNRFNISETYFDLEAQRILSINQLGILPVLNLRVEF